MIWKKKIFFVIFLLIISSTSFAQKPSGFLDRLFDKLSPPHASPCDEECKAKKIDPCDDLYQSICFDENGERKNDYKNLDKEWKNTVVKAWDLGAAHIDQSKDIVEYLRKKAKEELNLTLKEPLSEEEKNGLLFGFDPEKSRISELFEEPNRCASNAKELYKRVRDLPPSYLQDEKGKEEVLKLRNDTITFMDKLIKDHKDLYAVDDDNIFAELSRKIMSVCAEDKKCDLNKTRKELFDFYRNKDQIDFNYKKEITKILDKYYDAMYSRDLKDYKNIKALSPTDVDAVASGLKDWMYLGSICSDLTIDLMRDGVTEFMVEQLYFPSLTRPAVEHLLNTYYKQENYLYAKGSLEKMKQILPSITAEVFKDFSKEKTTNILNDYKKIDLRWFMLPTDDQYKKTANIEYYNYDEIYSAKGVVDNDEGLLGNVLFSPRLSFFRDLNAYFMPKISLGNTEVDSYINLMPATIALHKGNLFTMMTTLAHELGHRIDPKNLSLYGDDPEKAFDKFFECLKKRNGINVQRYQRGEVIADYISAEIMSKFIKENISGALLQKAAIMSCMQDFCMFDESAINDNSVDYLVSFTSTHPNNLARVNGIFGANKNVRELLGCKEASSAEYVSCDLNGEVKK